MAGTIFVSFSGRDSMSVQKLLSALQRQNLTYWDYSREGEQIPPGSDIAQECTRRIDAASHFLAVMSAHTCSADYGYHPQRETLYAIARRRDKSVPVIVPVVDTSSPFPEIVGPYKELNGLLRLSFDGTSQESVDRAVRKFCIETMGIDYSPSFPIDPRIRLIERFREEFKNFERSPAANPHFLRADYILLDDLMQQFSKDVSGERPEWKKALTRIGFAIDMIETHGLQREFYFPPIMRGLCEYELGRYDEAAETFTTATRHSRADVHAYAGLALIAWRNQDYASALRHLHSAERHSSGAMPWELQFNIVCAALASEEPVVFNDDLLKVDSSRLTPEDRIKYETLVGVYYCKTGRYQDAKTRLSGVVRRSQDDPSLADESAIIWLAECMVKLSEYRQAIRLLVSEGKLRVSGELYYRAARISVDHLGDISGACRLYESIYNDPHLISLKYALEYARTLAASGRAEHKAVCNRVLALARAKSGLNAEEHFYVGFAYYLLGNRALAEYEHDQGRQFATIPYGTV